MKRKLPLRRTEGPGGARQHGSSWGRTFRADGISSRSRCKVLAARACWAVQGPERGLRPEEADWQGGTQQMMVWEWESSSSGLRSHVIEVLLLEGAKQGGKGDVPLSCCHHTRRRIMLSECLLHY